MIASPRVAGTACVLALLLCGCAREGRAARGRRAVVDMCGRTVILPDSVRRVCSNGFSLNQLLLALGAAPRMVATTEAVCLAPWFRRLCPRVDSLAHPFAGESGGDPEALLKLRPDLVVLWNDDGFAARLREAGLAVMVVRFSGPEQMDSGMMLLGRALGGDAPRRAALLCALRDSIDSLVRTRLAGLRDSPRPGLYYSADDPLNTEGKSSIVTSWAERAGGWNVAARAGILPVRAQVSFEQVLSWNPRVVVCREEASRRRILSDPSWKILRAVREGAVFTCPRGVTAWSTRSGEAVLQPLWAASALHPERFRDIRMGDLVRRFFSGFYGYSADSSEVAAVLSGRAPAWESAR